MAWKKGENGPYEALLSYLIWSTLGTISWMFYNEPSKLEHWLNYLVERVFVSFQAHYLYRRTNLSPAENEWHRQTTVQQITCFLKSMNQTTRSDPVLLIFNEAGMRTKRFGASVICTAFLAHLSSEKLIVFIQRAHSKSRILKEKGLKRPAITKTKIDTVLLRGDSSVHVKIKHLEKIATETKFNVSRKGIRPC